MLGNAVRHLCEAGSGHGICKLTSFRLRREAFLLHSQIVPSRMWLPSRHSVICEQQMDESSNSPAVLVFKSGSKLSNYFSD